MVDKYPDLGIDLMPVRPCPGTIWRHRKHNPPDHWHEYLVIGVTIAGPSAEDACQYYTCRDTEALEWWDVAANSDGTWLYQSKDGHTIWREEPTVVYKSTLPDDMGLPWVRPLSEFLDGQFTEVADRLTLP